MAVLQEWEGVYALPPAPIPECCWCHGPSEAWYVVVCRLPFLSRNTQSWVVCEQCAAVGRDYIVHRKNMLKHLEIMRDLCRPMVKRKRAAS